LAVTAATAPPSAILGKAFSVSWTVANQGAVAAPGQWNDAVYVSDRPTFDNTATFVSNFSAPRGPLAAGASYTQTQKVSIPQTAPGNRYLLVVTDAYEQQPQTSTANDTFALPITLSAPDLTVTSASGPSSATAGDTVVLSWAVTNRGSVEAAG